MRSSFILFGETAATVIEGAVMSFTPPFPTFNTYIRFLFTVVLSSFNYTIASMSYTSSKDFDTYMAKPLIITIESRVKGCRFGDRCIMIC
jgi:hypothetical protein